MCGNSDDDFDYFYMNLLLLMGHKIHRRVDVGLGKLVDQISELQCSAITIYV